MNSWEEKYNKMITIANNSAEKKVLEMLKEGCCITECMDESGLSYKELSELLERANKWETENLCVQIKKDKK